MKKEYTKPIIEVIEIEETDVITSSPVTAFNDPLGLLNEDDAFDWFKK